jgi:flagellum-specific peptidoglycan hydrolase FlgJ
MMSEMETKVIGEIARAAVASERATGCPAELIAAQCILESGWLKSAPGNNCFGIKSYPGEAGRQLLFTTEWFTEAEAQRFLALGDSRTAALKRPDARHDGRREYGVMDWLASFPSLADCFAKRASLFAAGRYAPFAAAYALSRDFEALVNGIAPIYATDPGYAGQVIRIASQSNVQAALTAARGGQAV